MKKQNPEKLGELIDKLHQRFEGAVHFLKETSVADETGRQKLFGLPWFLVLGFPHTGKTTLLSQSKMDFVLSRKNHAEKHKVSHCEWWATREAVFLDVNSAYILQNRKTRRQRKLWFDFLELLHKHRRKQSFQGVIFAVDVEKLCSTHRNERNAYFHSLRGRLKDLVGYASGPFPLYFVLTKLDKLAGFNEFFDGLTNAESTQLLGITFSQAQIQSAQVMADAFDLEFDKLLARLNAGIIERLHQERNLDKRAIMKDFPLQIESIKKPLAAFLQNVSDISSLNQPCQLRGLYLCASRPELDNRLDRLAQPFAQTFSLQPWIPTTEVSHSRAYFTRGIFRQILSDREMVLTYTRQGRAKFQFYIQWGIVTIFSVLGVSMVGNWVQIFSRNMTDLNAIEQAMAQYQVMLTSPTPLDSHLLTLELAKLSDASTHAESGHIAWVMRTFLPDDAAVYKNANQVFQQTVQLMVAKQLHQFLENQLKIPEKSDPARLYSALRAYLMLNDSAHFNLSSVTAAFDESWQKQLEPADLIRLNQFLMQAFAQPAVLPIDENLVKNARFFINTLPKPAFAQALFAASNPAAHNLQLTFPLVDAHSIFQNGQSAIRVPAMFTARFFDYYYDTVSPQIADILVNGDWVTQANPSRNPISPDDLEQVRRFYIANYITTWENLLTHLDLAPFNSYQQAASTISLFTQPSSPLLQLVYQIVINTNITYHNAPTPISLAFAPFIQSSNQVLAENHNNLLQLADSLVGIMQNQNPAMAAFELAKIHMTSPGQQSDVFNALSSQVSAVPYPYNHWFHDMVKFSSQLILADTQKVISQSWHDMVYTEFAANCASLYPFNADAKQDMAFDDFNRFFSPQGRLNTFINFYLTPFIDTTQTTWKLKSFNDGFLPVPADSLAKLQAAAGMTQLFFPNASEQMSMPFLFRPMQVSPNIKQVELSIDNQSAEYSPDFMVATHFDWPGKADNPYVSMVLIDKNGQQATINLGGPWSLFHWLDTLAMPAQSTGGTLFSYQNPPYLFNFELMDTKGLTPLNLGLLHGFALPETL